ncbi:efflux RND transporter periplasmic adaptor subunit [Sphingomonas koreensis]|uniref:efflux RND transporter periplasmic adaptor subunit n=1 Tax=Sphingomonas koreensis TaxID=93064 RepID=UPI000832DFE5|nr:efflux RND transporter periplasmic adaptor subunit [Sphingomonas koreensis]PJI87234.1 Cu(I)/Ag(I) efflux system membrane fusion protein [Sphingomonas koreensis]RSU59555.1 efflux RND transporter periplasmic adaptor subunit [Sphingomonas koreensis]RSU68708.1 efflux RND transporter periplasmic adaptor subunit [Sphingomonas koreensis]
MTIELSQRARLAIAAAAIALIAGGVGYGLAQLGAPWPKTAAEDGRKVLYWYDPMVPSQQFDKPGKSPFMDMPLVPKYADEAGAAPGIRIDPARTQNLGLRAVMVERGSLANSLTATGVIDFNQRDVTIVQARAPGFVQRVYDRAPGDRVAAGAPLADLLIPEWAGAQTEYLAVRRTGDPALTRAARQRLALLGMPPGTIAAVERRGQAHAVVTVSTPSAGVVRALNVRSGMTLAMGQTLAEVNGLATVWLNAAIPEAMATQLMPGQQVSATLAAFPTERFSGRVAAILPDLQADSRTLTARIELPNRDGRLRPGMFATVSFGGRDRPALLVPSEAVIRTGKRTLVMLVLPGGRYQPAEIQAGIESGGRTEILAGLAEGEKVAASGQFLLDSEASLSAIKARPMTAPAAMAPQSSYEAVGRIEKIDGTGVTLSHGPVPALRWPAMTMRFRLGAPALAQGYKVGDRVHFAFDQQREGPTLRRIARETGR